MEFIDYPISLDDTIQSNGILLSRRNQLGLSQQQVAQGANIQLRQYQRLESGERRIESATMKTALSICAVLKLNPYVFFPEAESMNRYREKNTRNDDEEMKKEEAIPLLLQKACDLFNEKCHTDYSPENIKIAYFTMSDAVSVYKSFTQQYGFHSEKRTRGDFERMNAEAFVGNTDIDSPAHVDGILVRKDPPAELDRPDVYLEILVHELSHIFCTTHEIDSAGKAGGRFYDLYCEDTPGTPAQEYNNGYMNAGYAIWREFIADIMGDIVYQQPSMHLEDIEPAVTLISKEVKVGNSNAKIALSQYLSAVINTFEGSEAETWDELEPVLQKLNLPFIRILALVFQNLHGKPCHTIEPNFIESLGATYIGELIKNTPQEDMMKFAETYGYSSF